MSERSPERQFEVDRLRFGKELGRAPTKAEMMKFNTIVMGIAVVALIPPLAASWWIVENLKDPAATIAGWGVTVGSILEMVVILSTAPKWAVKIGKLVARE